MGGFFVDLGPHRRHKERLIRIHPERFLEHFEAGKLAWPETSDEEIEGRSKADWFAKSLALIQVFWFILNLVGRQAQGLGITTLELYTLGIVVCGIVTSSAYWEKPFDVSVPIVLQPSVDYHWDGVSQPDRVAQFGKTFRNEHTILWETIGVSLVFGAIHIGGWNFHFASFAERLMWRIASVSCTVIPVLFLLIVLYEVMLYNDRPSWVDVLLNGAVAVYTVCRLYMFVEMFVSLRAVPASVYQTLQWSQYFPSFD
jgi:hypothetical protein